jgi:hypothetical protein
VVNSRENYKFLDLSRSSVKNATVKEGIETATD